MNSMVIHLPEKDYILFKDLLVGDFFISRGVLHRKCKGVGIHYPVAPGLKQAWGETFNAIVFIKSADLHAFIDENLAVQPVTVEIICTNKEKSNES
jgi:hypothetical protein